VVYYLNLDSLDMLDPEFRKKQIEMMRTENEVFVIDLGGSDKNYIFYSGSVLLTRLLYFPYIQLLVIILFILVSYVAFSSSRQAEQNKVWVGLSKETAHQLGTPTTSLNGWVEILKMGRNDENTIAEIEKDVKRLEKITERFSKIGSRTTLTMCNLNMLVTTSVNYLKKRSSDRVEFIIKSPDEEIFVPLNEALFEWVLENVCKNAMDAIEGNGKIEISLHDGVQVIYIDIKDNGKGIPKSKHKTIFKPGYTTKERGWGLGLSLSKRIVESYHEGRIFILNSEINLGTTIRIVLKNINLRKK
jgi:signal transduction histidine kinase